MVDEVCQRTKFLKKSATYLVRVAAYLLLGIHHMGKYYFYRCAFAFHLNHFLLIFPLDLVNFHHPSNISLLKLAITSEEAYFHKS